jgi:hypothetical protein
MTSAGAERLAVSRAAGRRGERAGSRGETSASKGRGAAVETRRDALDGNAAG